MPRILNYLQRSGYQTIQLVSTWYDENEIPSSQWFCKILQNDNLGSGWNSGLHKFQPKKGQNQNGV